MANETVGLPVVSIAPSSTPVTEGTAAAFTLSRTGATDAALTVAVSVSQAGDVMRGAAPTEAVFAPGASEARLSVATDDDGADEPDARITASIAATSAFDVDDAARSARVDVFDNDEHEPESSSVDIWSSTLTWTDLGNAWLIANAEDFSNPGWSENGRDYRIWYIAYGRSERQMWVARDDMSGSDIAEPRQLALHVGGATIGGDVLSVVGQELIGIAHDIEQDWEVGDQVTVRLTRAAEAGTAPAGPALSVADAEVNESAGVPLRFRVTLGERSDAVVSVRYRTSDGTAHAGSDYVSAHGAVRFAPGETSKTVEVSVLEDTHDESSETMTLTLSAPHGATIADGVATGTITNTGAIPRAWIARFGRAVAEQAIDAVEARLSAPREAGFTGTLAGQPVHGRAYADSGDAYAGNTREGLETLAGWLERTDEEGGDAYGFGTRTLSALDVLSGSTFSLTQGTSESGYAAFWGRGAVTRFDGNEGDMTLDGEVASAMLGADFSRDAMLAGLMLSHSRGEGGYHSPSDSGTVESTLTALFPYGSYALTERVSMWAMAGYGSGTLTVTPQGQAPLRPDMDFLMGALGVRGVLVDGGLEGPTLAAKSDAYAVRTSTEALGGSAGNLAASEADVTRVRFALEGSRTFGLGGGAVLTPSLELGVRHDGGDAETGTGVDVGAGIRYAAGAFSIEGEVHALIAHEETGYEDWGASGALRMNPSPSGRGLSVSIAPVWGKVSSGPERLWSARDAAAFSLSENAHAGGRLEAEFGYGLGAGGGTLTPYTGMTFGDDSRTVRAGARWMLGNELTVGLEAAQSARDDTRDGQVRLEVSLRF